MVVCCESFRLPTSEDSAPYSFSYIMAYLVQDLCGKGIMDLIMSLVSVSIFGAVQREREREGKCERLSIWAYMWSVCWFQSMSHMK